MALNLDYKPVEVVSTAGMPESEWLEWRRKGIGGSDSSAVMGPFIWAWLPTTMASLSGRFSAAGSPESTGNSVFVRIGGEIRIMTGLYAIRVQSDKTVPLRKLYRKLLKSAKDAGLDHAYIVRSSRTAPDELLRVDVSTGKEKLVVGNIVKPDSRRAVMKIKDASEEEIVHPGYGGGGIFISPKAVLLEDVELNVKD